MSSEVLAARYAQALLDAAEEQQLTAEIAQQINMLAGQIAGNDDYRQLLCGKSIDASRKKDLIEQAYGEALHPYVRNFLFVLFDKNREGMIEEALLAFNKLYREKLGVAVVRLTTAKPIDAETEEKFIASLRSMLKKDVELETRVDPSLMGGAVINVNDLMIDGSLRNKLRRLREELMR